MQFTSIKVVNVGSRDNKARTSWRNILTCCGSNAFNQLSGGAAVLKSPSDMGGSGMMELYYPLLTPFQLVVKDTVVPVIVGKIGNDSKLLKNKTSTSSSIIANNGHINNISRSSSSSSGGSSSSPVPVNQYIKHVCCGSNATCVVVDADNWDSNKLYVWGSGTNYPTTKRHLLRESNLFGLLGIGKSTTSNVSFISVVLPSKCSVTAISCGQRHAVRFDH